jgi:dGTPase
MQIPDELHRRIKEDFATYEAAILGPFGYPTNNATRRTSEPESLRTAFTRDADRIIHSMSFSRYFDKTQVFFWIKSDIHSHRMLHVQLVSKLARYIARILRMNEDLVEAIALGHDIGHCPFGHDGEMVLRALCQNHGIGQLWHNYESVWFLQEIEMQNLTLPVLDGILCHNGESHHREYSPVRDQLSWNALDRDMEGLLTGKENDPKPKTLEACLVRLVDTISYISRDVQDAENLGILNFSDIPDSVKAALGTSNRDIINSLVTDLIVYSYGKDLVGYSEPVYNALQDLYRFNYKNIYTIHKKQMHIPKITQAFRTLWDHFYEDLIHKRKDSRIFTDHLELNLKQIAARNSAINSIETYPYAQYDPKLIVRDFLAGMTDQYFWLTAKECDPTLDFEYEPIY